MEGQSDAGMVTPDIFHINERERMDIKFPFGSFPGEFLQKYFESNCTLMLIEEIDFVLNN